MDKIIKNYTGQIEDDDLMLCVNNGVAYQKDMRRAKIIKYGKEYWDEYDKRKNTEIAVRLNAARKNIVDKYIQNIYNTKMNP